MTEAAVKPKSRSGSQKRQRNRHIGVCCTPEQFAAVSEKAGGAGISRSAYALMVMLDAPAPRKRRLPVVHGELLATGITALNRAGNNANQIARELNQQGLAPGGGFVARAVRGDNGAILAVEAMRQMLEATCTELRIAAAAIIRAAGYDDVRGR